MWVGVFGLELPGGCISPPPAVSATGYRPPPQGSFCHGGTVRTQNIGMPLPLQPLFFCYQEPETVVTGFGADEAAAASAHQYEER